MNNEVFTEEWFSGSGTFSKVARDFGYYTVTIDNNPKCAPHICKDVRDIKLWNGRDIFWASPPCTGFSVASISHHWTGGKSAYIPKSETVKLGIELLEYTIKSIAESKPRKWFIENPRGIMRKIIDKIFLKYGVTDYKRVTVCLCRVGDTRMRPTDIWCNDDSWYDERLMMCHNGFDDHERAPRGSKTGTQGLKNAYERGKLPEGLFKAIFNGLRSRQ